MKASLLSLLLLFLTTHMVGQSPKRDTSAPKGGWIVPTAEELKKVEAAIPAELPAKPKGDRKLLVYSLSHGFKHNSRLIGEEMLKLIQCIPANGNEEANRKRNNNNRIYEEYVSTLNDLLDKWTSLRLVDGEQKRKSSD